MVLLERDAALVRGLLDVTDNIAKGANVKTELDKAVKAIDQDIKDNGGYPVK